MGNSVRSTLGNLCGGQQALADFDENERPVSRPKESKKKEKKLKKNKKEKNGDLPPISERSEEKVLPETPVVEKEPIKEKNDVPTNDETPKGNTANSSKTEVKGARKVLSVYDNVDDDGPEIHSEEKKFEGKILGNESTEGVEEPNKSFSTGSSSDRKNDEIIIPEKRENEKENTIQREENSGKNEEKSEIEIEMSIDKQDEQDESEVESFGNKEGKDGKVNYICKVEPIKPELLGISYADKIFSKAAEIYEPFFHSNEKFKNSLHEFKNIVNHEEGNSNFESCLRNYQEFCKSEIERDAVTDLQGENAKVDISDMNASLQNVRSTGIILLQDIELVRPAFDKAFASAGTIDVIDYVKGTVADEDQLGITSKFSAPGKCRRNMLQLKKGVKLLDGVEKETKNIMNLIENQPNAEMKLVGNKNLRLNSPCDFSAETPSRHDSNNKDDRVQDYDEESVIIPSPVKVDNINMIEKLSTLPQLENDDTVPEKKSDEFSNIPPADTSDETPVPQDSETVKTLLKQAKTEERPESPEAKTYIIENIPEESPKSPPKANLPERESPKLILPPLGLPHTKSAAVKSPVTQLVVEEEDHSILDFGKYVFIDPSTGDIQVMRNRSRSLDSLVSMTSNRSSLSRFGSFELVTDFEINIAEKNQQSFLPKE